jgi:hypothetical protein
VALAISTVLLVAASCSDDPQADEERRTSNPPEEIIVDGLGRIGNDKAIVQGDEITWLVFSSLGAAGSPQTEGHCLLDLAQQYLPGEPPLDSMTVSDALRIDRTIKKQLDQDQELFAVVDACTSEDSTARQEAGELPDDFDFVIAQDISVVVGRGTAEAMGLTPEEAECYSQTAFGSIPRDEYKAKLIAREVGTLDNRTAAIIECLTPERLDEAALEIEVEILEDNERRAREQQEIQQEINDQLGGTTTTP